MGMKNSAQSFQRMMDSILAGMPNVFCYLDDLLIYNKSEKEHLETLDILFKKLADAGLPLALSKCLYGVSSLDYQGYMVSPTGIAPMKRKVEGIQNFPQPTKQKEMLAFLGSLNYYRASLPKLSAEESADPKSAPPTRTPAEVLDPLYKLATCKLAKTKTNAFADIWNNSAKIQNALKDAKTLLTKAVTLNHPVPSAPLSLSTDASKIALGASLDQWVGGAWRPLGFWSKSLRPEQQRYSTYIRELLAIKFAVRHFVNEINERELIIFTDNKPLLGS